MKAWASACEDRAEMDDIAAEQGEMTRDERREFFREKMQEMQEEMQAERMEQGLDLEMKAALKEMFDLFEAWTIERPRCASVSWAVSAHS